MFGRVLQIDNNESSHPLIFKWELGGPLPMICRRLLGVILAVRYTCVLKCYLLIEQHK